MSFVIVLKYLLFNRISQYAPSVILGNGISRLHNLTLSVEKRKEKKKMKIL